MVQCDANSKDHRPDLKQLVWILTVAADGAVPIAYRLADGNTTDDPTHVPTWDGLVALLGRTDFLYVADAKLCSREAMGHIDRRRWPVRHRAAPHPGRGPLVPRLDPDQPPQWTEALRLPGTRLGEPDQVYSTFPAPLPSAEGHRIVWVHSTAKAARDAASRPARVEAGAAAIDALAVRLAGPKMPAQDPGRRRTRPPPRRSTDAGASRWVSATIGETVEESFRQERRGRPGTNTRYRRHTRTRHTISWNPTRTASPTTPPPTAASR